jgi:hypothetical protein
VVQKTECPSFFFKFCPNDTRRVSKEKTKGAKIIFGVGV